MTERDSGEIVVTGTRTPGRLADSPVAMEVITREELEVSGADTLAEALEGRPGLQVARSFRGSALQLRGLDPDYTLVLLDGQPLVGRIGGAIDLSRILIEDVERVEIVKGAGSALYGADAIGGVVNIISRKGRRGVHASSRLSGGSFLGSQTEATSTRLPGAPTFISDSPINTGDIALGLDVGGRGMVSRTGLSGITTPAVLDPDGGMATVWDGQGTLSINERLDLVVTDQHRWFGRGGYTVRQSAGTDSNDAGAVLDRSQTSEFIETAVGPDILFGEMGRLQVNLSWNAFRDQYLVDQRGAPTQDVYEETWDHATELDVVSTWLVGQRHALTGGLEGRTEHLTADRLDPARVDRQRVAAFVQDVWELTADESLLLVTGIRHDQDTLFGGASSPRAAIRWDPAERLIIRASVGRGFRAPPLKDLFLSFQNQGANYRVDGNPELEPERSWSETVDIDWGPTEGVDLRFAAFRNDLTNMITADLVAPSDIGSPARYSYVNVARAWTQGLEVGAAHSCSEQLRFGVDATLLQTQDLEAGRPLNGRPPVAVDGHVGIGGSGTSLRLETRGSWQAPAPFVLDDDGDGVATRMDAPAWWLLDSRLAWQTWRGFEVFVGVDNALDTGDVQLRPGRPRRVFAGVNGRLGTTTRGNG